MSDAFEVNLGIDPLATDSDGGGVDDSVEIDRGTNPSDPTAAWGTPDSRDFQVHLLTGFPGVGPELAERIIDHFGGVPWTWKITVEELQQVAGIGKRKAEQIMGLVPA